jgi:hypothetical protein
LRLGQFRNWHLGESYKSYSFPQGCGKTCGNCGKTCGNCGKLIEFHYQYKTARGQKDLR